MAALPALARGEFAFIRGDNMESDKPPERNVAAPTEVWEKLVPEQRERVILLLTQMAYKMIVARKEQLTQESSSGNTCATDKAEGSTMSS